MVILAIKQQFCNTADVGNILGENLVDGMPCQGVIARVSFQARHFPSSTAPELSTIPLFGKGFHRNGGVFQVIEPVEIFDQFVFVLFFKGNHVPFGEFVGIVFDRFVDPFRFYAVKRRHVVVKNDPRISMTLLSIVWSMLIGGVYQMGRPAPRQVSL